MVVAWLVLDVDGKEVASIIILGNTLLFRWKSIESSVNLNFCGASEM